MRKISCFACGVLLFTLILSGCGKLDRKNPPPVNMRPEVFFSNIPPEGDSVSVNPRIYWYGTDMDGFILAYQYAVIKKSVSDSWGGLDAAKDSLEKIGPDSATWVNNTIRLNIFGEHIPALKGQQRNVRMYAEMDPKDYTQQYIFLRAVDNAGGTSVIKTLMFWRNNHAPTCSVAVDTSYVSKSFYCLSETTQTWKGIEIGWVGSDILDYPDKRKQPDLYFKWDLWGPYKDRSSLTDPYAAKVDSSLDSIRIEGGWIYDRWTLDKSHIFKKLENYKDLGYGWYHLRVWSRDDAFVSSKDSATTFVRILKPLFLYEKPSRKSILVLDATVYGGNGGPDTLTKVWPFYQSALAQQGICDNSNLNLLTGDRIPSEDSLSRYDLVIVLNLGKVGGLEEKAYVKYKNYLDVGGRLWIIGMDNYKLMGQKRHCLAANIRSTAPITFEVATEYLGVECVFLPQFTASDSLTLEFIAAKPFGSWGLPYLEMDSTKAKELKGYKPIWTKDNYWNFAEKGIPHVPYDELTNYDFAYRAPLFRRLYSFVARSGVNSDMNLYPCATTYIGPTYRTAEFTFPLNLMKEEGAKEAFRKVVQWFWQDLPQP